MPSLRYASPTFALRSLRGQALAGAFENLAACGFAGLELFGLFGFEAEDMRRLCHSLGLEIVCDHIHYETFLEDTDQVLENARRLELRFITIDNIPEALLPGNPGFDQARREIKRVGDRCRKSGLQLLYHNHGYDLLRRVDGVPTLDLLLDAFDPALLGFQPDLGWLRLGGGDPAYYLQKYRDRCPIIHFKDFYADRPVTLPSPFGVEKRRGGAELGRLEFRPTGYGVMNFPALMPSVLACAPQWITTDHDAAYDRNIYDDLALSLEYTKALVAIHAQTEEQSKEE